MMLTKHWTAQDVMTRTVHTARADWSTDELAEFLMSHSISGAPVIGEGGRLLGVVSMTDLVRYSRMPERHNHPHTPPYYLYLAEHPYAEEELASFRVSEGSETQVADVMTSVIFKVTADTPLTEVADTMVRGHIHRVFVTEGDQLVGVVTALDVLKYVQALA